MSNQQSQDVSDAAQYWEDLYSRQPRRWSGRVNETVADVVSTLPAGEALDLGCGEGGDAVWLAQQGWRVTAVDVSSTALGRAAEWATAADVTQAVTWVREDLSTWTTAKTFDLVTASFLHSTVDLPRTEILRRTAGHVRPDGHLLLVSHVFETAEDIPPWARGAHGASDHNDDGLQAHANLLLTPSEEIAELALDESEWEIVVHEIRPREAAGPDGNETAKVKDGVVLLRRRSRR